MWIKRRLWLDTPPVALEVVLSGYCQVETLGPVLQRAVDIAQQCPEGMDQEMALFSASVDVLRAVTPTLAEADFLDDRVLRTGRGCRGRCF